MNILVDTCGWIEWLTNGNLAQKYSPHLKKPQQLLIPTVIQYELYKWICRERDEILALSIISITEQGNIPNALEFSVFMALLFWLRIRLYIAANSYSIGKMESFILSQKNQTESRKLKCVWYIIPLDTHLALAAADVSKEYNLAMADAIIYATCNLYQARLITSDKHFASLTDVDYFTK